jgi:nitrite reductase/ring-hydroxylating ferredoxin subunit
MAKEFKLKDVTSLNLKNGEKKEVEVEGVEGGKVLLLKVQDKVHATSANCTHYGAPLAKGVLTPEGRLTCPWHGGKVALHMRKALTDISQPAFRSQRAMLKMHRLSTPYPSTRYLNAMAPYTSRQTKTHSRPTGDT